MRWVWLSGLATLLSLPIGLVIVGLIYLPPYDPTYEHSPGIGVAFLPVLVGWVACAIIWTAIFGVAIARGYMARNSN